MNSALTYRQQVSFGVVYALIVGMFLLDSQFHFSAMRYPFEWGVRPWLALESKLNSGISFPRNFVKTVLTSQKMIADLQSKNAQLQVQVAEAESTRKENELLKKELEKGVSGNNELFNTILLSRIIQDGKLVYLDKGANQGVKSGAFVMSQEILLGRVEKVDQFFAQAVTFSKGSWQTVAQTQNGVRGVVTGGNNQVLFTQVAADESFEVGDSLFTVGSVTDGVPPELYIGQIQEKIEKIGAPVQSARVHQGVDIHSTQLVSIKMRE